MKATMSPLFAMILTITAIAGQTVANEPVSMTAELQEIMRLSRNPRTKQRAFTELARLREAAPNDARLPYAYALGLIERLDYRGALVQVREAVRLDPSHLNAWKTRIWLAAANRDFSDAMASMEQLTSLMPAEGTPEVERKCRHFCGFMGSIFGYMEGPQSDGVESLELESSRRRIVKLLPTERQPIFEASRNQVLEGFKSQLGQIEVTRDVARKRAAAFRSTRLEQLDDEQKFVYRELDKLEKLRLNWVLLALACTYQAVR